MFTKFYYKLYLQNYILKKTEINLLSQKMLSVVHTLSESD